MLHDYNYFHTRSDVNIVHPFIEIAVLGAEAEERDFFFFFGMKFENLHVDKIRPKINNRDILNPEADIL